MSYILSNRLLSTRIYKVDGILFNNTKRAKPLVNLVLNVERSPENFLNTVSMMKFIPNAVPKVYHPDVKFIPSTFKTMRNTTLRNDFFKEMKLQRIPFNQVLTLEKITSTFNKKPIFFELTQIREEYYEYCNIRKKNATTGYMGFKQIISQLDNYVKLGNTYNLLIEIKPNDIFIESLIYGIQRDFKLLTDILKKFKVVMFNKETGVVFTPDFANISSKASVTNLIKRAVKTVEAVLAGDVTALKSSDITVVTDSSMTKQEKELFDASHRLEVDENDQDEQQTEDPTSNINDETEDTEASVDQGSGEGDINGDEESLPERPAEEITVDELDLDAILDIGNDVIDSTAIAVEKENKEFLEKMLPVQQAALLEAEKEANELSKDKTLDVREVKDDTIINANMRNIGLNSITSSYYKKQYKKDIIEIVKSLNSDPEHPVIVTKMEIKDSSTSLSKLDELHVEFVDKKRKKHNFTVDVPRLSHDGFMYINGNKKFIAKQATLHPVIKEAADRVQITTNYRKTFLYRKGDKINGEIDRLIRVLVDKNFPSIDKVYGNSYVSNLEYDVSIPYNFVARKAFSLTFKIGGSVLTKIVFSQKNIREELADAKITVSERMIPIGIRYVNGKIDTVLFEEISSRRIYGVFAKTKSQKQEAGTITELLSILINTTSDSELMLAYRKQRQTLSLSYTEAKIVSTSIALGCLIAAYKGLIPAIDLIGAKYVFEQKLRTRKESEIVLPFKDVYLFIDTEFDPSKELFLNGLLFLNTSEYNIKEAVRMSPIFLEYFDTATGSRNTAKALLNFESSMIDPITLETLQELKLPTQFSELLIYGNSLLSSYKRDRKNDLAHFRIRDSEVISVAVYNSLMDSFNNYKRTLRSGIPQSINTRRDDVVKKIQDMANVEDYSTLNPFLEIEMKAKTTYKGPSGLTN